MDKSWVKEYRFSEKYELGVENFLSFAIDNSEGRKFIPCPCSRCVNLKKLTISTIRIHLFKHGFSLSYTTWIWHGENSSSLFIGTSTGSVRNPCYDYEMFDMCEAAFKEGYSDDYLDDFRKFVEDGEQPLYKNSENSKLQSLVKLQYLKARHLHDIVRERGELDLFAFVDPSRTHNCERPEFINYIVDRLKEGKTDRLFLIPYNPGGHWLLTTIYENEIYVLDSLSRPFHYKVWENTMISALKTFNAVTGVFNKAPKLTYLEGVPKQSGGIECGYFVMRYMKEIINDDSLSFSSKWAINKSRKLEFTQHEIDEMRIELCEYLENLV